MILCQGSAGGPITNANDATIPGGRALGGGLSLPERPACCYSTVMKPKHTATQRKGKAFGLRPHLALKSTGFAAS